MLLYDTLSMKKREFRPLRGRKVGIYTCGPSVYSYSHIGNFRTYVFEDVLVRYLRYRGYEVKRVMNITDVEDKALQAAAEEGVSFRELSRDKCRVFFGDWRRMGLAMPEVVARVSDYVPLMVGLIRKICRKGYCITEKDGVYFDVRKFRDYGKLRHLKGRKYLGPSRHDDYSKEGLWDFILWKYHTRGEGSAVWESPFGRGRPGWHIECSAISMHFLGESFDIHCGGTDNIFPHHENEIAQSESASGKRLANFWMHARHLTVGKKKMSKRTGNVLYVGELEKLGVPPKCLRYYLLSERYRSRLDFTIEKFQERICDCNYTRDLMKRLARLGGSGGGELGARVAGKLLGGFEDAMDDDLNTRLAQKRIYRISGEIEGLLKRKKLAKADARAILAALKKADSVLRVF
ncbi:MAG TPA: cysteine--tRNA ligase [Candidatus Bilamarchaeum sp.]|nr:cysteine--tRNA ligase [Candidatus Bilamarchaeum sp.]